MGDKQVHRFGKMGWAILLLISLGIQLGGQDLPQLLPSYRNRFYQDDASYAVKCFNKAVRDERGRVWLDACGVHRLINSIGFFQFDGYEYQPFQPFRPDDGSPLVFPGIFGRTNTGQLLGVGGGMQFFLLDPDTRKIEMARMPESDGDLAVKGVLLRDTHALVTVSDPEGKAALWKLEGNTIHELWQSEFPMKWVNASAHLLWATAQDYWLMGSWFPLLRIDRESLTVRTYLREALDVPADLQPAAFNQNKLISTLAAAPNGDLYLLMAAAQGKYLLRYDPATDRFLRADRDFPADWEPEELFVDERGALCLLFRDAEEGYRAVLLTPEGQRWDYSPVLQAFSNITDLTSRDFSREVLVIDNGELNNVGVRQAKAIRSTLPDKWISSMISLPAGDLLVNTIGDAWFRVDPATGAFSEFQGPTCSGSDIPFGKGMRQQLIPDRDGGIWFSSGQLLNRYDPVRGTCETVMVADQQFQLFCPLNDHLFVVQKLRNNLDFLDIRSGSVVDMGPDIPKMVDASIRDLFLDTRNLLWMITTNGLWRIDWQNGTSRRYTMEDGFADNRFTAIFEDSQKRLWLGAYSGGLHIFDPQSGEITIIDEKEGLSNNAVMSIIDDAEGMIWVATEYGITLLSEEGKVVTGIYREDGLAYDIFERFDPWRDAAGLLYFGSRNGITIIDPAEFKRELKQDEAVKIYLTELRYYDRTTDKDVTLRSDLQNLPTIHISPAHPYFHLKFSLSTLLEPQKHRYAYRFTGLSDRWTELGKQSELNIDRLPPGRYELQVTGADFRNRSPEEPVRIPLVVHDFFFRQPWFYGVAALPFIFFGLLWARNKQLENRRLEAEVARRTEEIRADRDLIEAQAQELQQVDEMKTRFFSNISHELRTPVTLITAPVEELLEQESNGKSSQTLQLVLRNARKLKNLVEELLELSRVDAHRVNLNEEATALTPFCYDLFMAYQPAATMKSIQFIYASSLSETAAFYVDRNRLEKIINNLLSNALKFTPRNGLVKLSITLEEDRLHFEVLDTGRGIPEEDLPHVFDRYFQTNKKDISVEGGTGIGLSLSHELAKLMKGELRAESEWGKGACFHLWLPARPAASGATAVKTEPQIKWSQDMLKAEPEASATAKDLPRLLIVEDNPDMQALLVSLLSGRYQCRVAQHGGEAWRWLEEETEEVAHIDLILSDIMMPEMDGYALLDRIKQHPRWKQLPVIMLTAKTAEEDKLQALRMGVDDYLMKPFSPEELRVRVANLIANYRERQAARQAENQETVGVAVDFDPVEGVDLSWLKEVEEGAKEALDKGIKLTTIFLADKVFLSERQFARKLKTITGLTPNQYIQEIKLQKARHLLENKACQTVSEVAGLTGFSSGSYLTKLYKDHFGKAPSEYL